MKIVEYKENRIRSKYQRSLWVNEALLKLELLILYRNMWHKPIISCIFCMSSFWGIIIFILLPIEHNLYMLILGIPVASSISVYTQKLRI